MKNVFIFSQNTQISGDALLAIVCPLVLEHNARSLHCQGPKLRKIR